VLDSAAATGADASFELYDARSDELLGMRLDQLKPMLKAAGLKAGLPSLLPPPFSAFLSIIPSLGSSPLSFLHLTVRE
jgi:hypothetical protein